MQAKLTGALLVLASAGIANADTLIHAGTMIDGESDRTRNEVTLRVSGDLITAIEDGYTAAQAGDTVIDLRDQTVMPGLMDMHVHLTGQYSAQSNLNRFILNEADYAFDARPLAAVKMRGPGTSPASIALRSATVTLNASPTLRTVVKPASSVRFA